MSAIIFIEKSVNTYLKSLVRPAFKNFCGIVYIVIYGYSARGREKISRWSRIYNAQMVARSSLVGFCFAKNRREREIRGKLFTGHEAIWFLFIYLFISSWRTARRGDKDIIGQREKPATQTEHKETRDRVQFFFLISCNIMRIIIFSKYYNAGERRNFGFGHHKLLSERTSVFNNIDGKRGSVASKFIRIFTKGKILEIFNKFANAVYHILRLEQRFFIISKKNYLFFLL